jgi:hypothetical protein
MEGLITMILGISSFFLITDFPEKNKFLTTAQTKFIMRRIEEDRGDSVPDTITAAKVWMHLTDWKIWVFGGCSFTLCRGF